MLAKKIILPAVDRRRRRSDSARGTPCRLANHDDGRDPRLRQHREHRGGRELQDPRAGRRSGRWTRGAGHRRVRSSPSWRPPTWRRTSRSVRPSCRRPKPRWTSWRPARGPRKSTPPWPPWRRPRRLVAELEAGSRRQEIDAARRSCPADRGRAEPPGKGLRARAEQLFQQNTISQEQYDQATAAYDVAVERYRQALQQYDLVKEGPRQEQIDQAKAARDQAECAVRAGREGPPARDDRSGQGQGRAGRGGPAAGRDEARLRHDLPRR